jgi:hypothetical protein
MSTVIRFRASDTLQAATGKMRPHVERSVRRSIQKLPMLGALNPDAALLIGQQIDDWIPRSNGGASDRDLAADHAQTSPHAEAQPYLTRVDKVFHGGNR